MAVNRRLPRLPALLSALLLTVSTQAAGAGGEPPTVEVETVEAQPLRLWQRYPGRLQAVERVELRPQVQGLITRVLFEDGARVARGDLLFEIDPRPYEAEVAGAQAALASAESELRLAKAELKRAENLASRQAASQSQLDTARHNARRAQAAVAAAQARLRKARLDLEYTRIEAPVSGHISRARVTRGNLVEAGANAPVLASIVATDRLYARFDLDEQTYTTVLQRRAETIPVKVHSASNDVHHSGFVHAFDNHLDTSSGTVRVWASIPNPEGLLVPGMFVTVQMGLDSPRPQLLVDQRAIGTNQDKKFVYVISPQNRVTYREVELGSQVDGRQVITRGLESGDRVMTNSLMRVRPEMEVRPVESPRHDTAGEETALRSADNH